ncbi:MAG: hypothetical protein ACT4TC_24270 [Myxococcaceae bacterium]
MKRAAALTVLLFAVSACPREPTRFLCDPVTGRDCEETSIDSGVISNDGGSSTEDGGGSSTEDGGTQASGCPSSGAFRASGQCELPVAVSISMGSTCVRSEQGHVACAGALLVGRAAVGPSPEALRWVPLPEPITQLNAGLNVICALGSSGRGWCWGHNSTGALGNGQQTDAVQPTLVAASDFSARGGDGRMGCGAQRDGGVLCWGQNSRTLPGGAQSLGFPTDDDVVTTPTSVQGLTEPISQTSNDGVSTWGLTASGDVWVWGASRGPYLDAVSVANQPGPRKVALPFKVAAVATGLSFTLAVDVDGGTWLWGGAAPLMTDFVFPNDAGYLTEPLRLETPPAVISICTGNDHACVLTREGTVWCWGHNNRGQLGDGTRISRRELKQVEELRATSLSCRDDFSCAATREGVKCWGHNLSSRMGAAEPAETVQPTVIRTASEGA